MSLQQNVINKLEADVPFRDAASLPFPASSSASADRESNAISSQAYAIADRFFLQPGQKVRLAVLSALGHPEQTSRLNLAVAQAIATATNESVCLVESNFDNPMLPGLLGRPNERGLLDALSEGEPIDSYVAATRTTNLWLLPSGLVTASRRRLLSTDRVREQFHHLRKRYSYILVNGSPLVSDTETVNLARSSDGLILVLEAGSTRREAAQAAVVGLRSAGITILGAVLNNRTFPIPERLYRRL